MLMEELAAVNADNHVPFMTAGARQYRFSDVLASGGDLGDVQAGDVVAIIGDFSPTTINLIIRLIDAGAILVPLAEDTRGMHHYCFEVAGVDVVIDHGQVRRIRSEPDRNPLLEELRGRGHPGLVLFSSGTTGRPKAILHDFEKFLERFRNPRPAFKTLNFLLFDHIGGINTLLHTLFNKGEVVVPSARTPAAVIDDIRAHGVELLPTTPTFLRMLLMSGLLEEGAMPSLKVVTYGTEPMDQPTLERLCAALPGVDLRQTYGMSELGILRVRSKARDSLWMKVGGEGVDLDIREGGVLWIKSDTRMVGYLNADLPMVDGWYNTGDVVEADGEWLRICGRTSKVINVGGLKILPEEIERVALLHPEVLLVHATGKPNPITGQHIEVTCQPRDGAAVDVPVLRAHFARLLPEGLRPHRIRVGTVDVNHRFKKC